ncbi:MAG: sodium:solute symporter, partial [Paludibacteraceae bacterium]|nr:sodium:solute symporter [Paludibacteraceae bacterium]
AITYMAYPAKAFATNWTYYPMLVTILLVSFPVIRYYLPFFRRLNITSAYEYLELRFNTLTRLLASALFIVFMVARMALVLYLPSLALTAVTGIDIYLCIVLMGVVTIIYCTMGGVEAVVWGDVVQGFILLGGAVFAVIYLIFSTEGGWGGFTEIALADDKLRLVDWSFDFTKATFWVVILGGIANNLISYTSDQTVIQRYLTTKDERSASQSILMNGLMSVFASVAFFAIGAGLYTFYKTHPMELDVTMSKTDTIFPFFMMSQLPAGVAGLLIAAIFAATMSTISSNINSVATAFSVDFYKRLSKNVSDEKMLKVARWTCVLSGLIGVVIAVLMATWNIYSLLDFFQEILGLLSSGLGGLFVMGIFLPRINARSALIGFVCGILTVFAVKYFTNLNLLLYGFIGMVVSIVVGYVVSLLQKNTKSTVGLTWRTLDK